LRWAAFLLLPFLAACDDREPHPYPAEVEETFMQACDNTSEENTRACRCLFKAIRREYTFEQFLEIDEQSRMGQTPEHFTDYIDEMSIPCYVVNLI